jgi:hypothetical protein
VNVQVNNKVDAAIMAHRLKCGHTMADHGMYAPCPDAVLLDTTPACRPDAEVWGTHTVDEEEDVPLEPK